MDRLRPKCPKCGDVVWRDEVDVGVGYVFGPYGCSSCRWSEDPYYDCSNGESKASQEFPDDVVDQWGGLTPRLRKGLNNLAKKNLVLEGYIEDEYGLSYFELRVQKGKPAIWIRDDFHDDVSGRDWDEFFDIIGETYYNSIDDFQKDAILHFTDWLDANGVSYGSEADE